MPCTLAHPLIPSRCLKWHCWPVPQAARDALAALHGTPDVQEVEDSAESKVPKGAAPPPHADGISSSHPQQRSVLDSLVRCFPPPGPALARPANARVDLHRGHSMNQVYLWARYMYSWPEVVVPSVEGTSHWSNCCWNMHKPFALHLCRCAPSCRRTPPTRTRGAPSRS